MNAEPPPLPPAKGPGPLSLQRYGCFGIFLVLVALTIVAVLALRYALVDTALPFKAVAALIESGDANVKVEGVTGSLATGPGVASISWGADPAHRSEILDLRVKYNGLAHARENRRVIIEEVGVRKAHLDVTDMAAMVTTTRTTFNTGGGAPAEPASALRFPSEIDSFEIRRVLIEDVRVVNRRTAFQLSIPKVEWTGFKATPQGVEAGELHVESDRLTLHTGPGGTREIAGERVTFEKSLTGTLEPRLHAAIRKPLSFTLDFTFVPEMKAPAFHLLALDGKVELTTNAEGGHSLHVRRLELPALLDAKALYGPESADFPSELMLEVVAAPDGGRVRIVRGSFRLGVTMFHIDPAELASNLEQATLQAVARTEVGEIRWSLALKEVPVHFRPRFTANPDLPPTEILARVFAGKGYDGLSVEERRAIDARQSAYFSGPAP